MNNAISITYSNAMAASRDVGNKSMIKAGRAAWNEDDWNEAAECFNRLARQSDQKEVKNDDR